MGPCDLDSRKQSEMKSDMAQFNESRNETEQGKNVSPLHICGTWLIWKESLLYPGCEKGILTGKNSNKILYGNLITAIVDFNIVPIKIRLACGVCVDTSWELVP